jgi:hypothetical protein
MSYEASKFVAESDGLTAPEKAVAFVLAFHAAKDTAEAYPAMARIARETGLQTERSARRVVRQLEKKLVIIAVSPKTGGRGRDRATVYRVNVASARDKTRTATSSFAEHKPGQNQPETRTELTRNPDKNDRKPGPVGPANSKELKRSVSECQAQGHTHASMEEKGSRARSIAKSTTDPIDDSSPSRKGNTVRSSNGSPAARVEGGWLKVESLSDEQRIAVSISGIGISGGRKLSVNSKCRVVIRKLLGDGVPGRDIFEAAQEVGASIPERDCLPDKTLADKLETATMAREWRRTQEREAEETRRMQAEERQREAEREKQIELIKSRLQREEERSNAERESFYDGESRQREFVSSNPKALDRYDLRQRMESGSALDKMVLGKDYSRLIREEAEARLANPEMEPPAPVLPAPKLSSPQAPAPASDYTSAYQTADSRSYQTAAVDDDLPFP